MFSGAHVKSVEMIDAISCWPMAALVAENRVAEEEDVD